MKKLDKTAFMRYIFIVGIICCLHIIFAGQAFAADSQPQWRPLYDIVMRWINFLILVFILVKFGKKPLKNFLQGQKDDLEIELHELEKEKQEAVQKLKQTEKILDESNTDFVKLTERIVEQGEKKKQVLIEEATQEAKIMLEQAKRKISSYILKAKGEFRSELVDKAMSIAIEKLKSEISSKDNDKFINQYVSSIQSK